MKCLNIVVAKESFIRYKFLDKISIFTHLTTMVVNDLVSECSTETQGLLLRHMYDLKIMYYYVPSLDVVVGTMVFVVHPSGVRANVNHCIKLINYKKT